VRRWLLGALINGVFGGSSTSTIGIARTIVRESLQTSRDFPFHELNEGLLKRRGRLVAFDEETNVDALLARIMHQGGFEGWRV
jgi:hypothetical protein